MVQLGDMWLESFGKSNSDPESSEKYNSDKRSGVIREIEFRETGSGHVEGLNGGWRSGRPTLTCHWCEMAVGDRGAGPQHTWVVGGQRA